MALAIRALTLAIAILFPITAFSVAVDDDGFRFGVIVLLTLAVAARRVLAAHLDHDRDILNPVSLFVLFFYFYHALYPLLLWLLAERTPVFAEHAGALWLTLGGLLAFEVALLLFPARRRSPLPPLYINRWLLAVTPIAFIATGPLWIRVGIGPEAYGYVALLFALVLARLRPSALTWVYVLAIFAAALAGSIHTFTRAYIVQMPLLLVFMWHHWRRRISLGAFALGVPLLLAVLLALGVYRTTGAFGIEEWARLRDFALLLAGNEPALLLRSLRILDFPVAFEAFRTILESVPRSVDYLYGETYTKFFLYLVPREILPEKPVEISRYFVWVFVDAHSTDYSIAPTLLGELYWNLGAPGALGVMFALGIAFKWLHVNHPVYRESPFAFAIMATVVLMLPLIMRGGTPTVLLHILRVLVPIVAAFTVLNARPSWLGPANRGAVR